MQDPPLYFFPPVTALSLRDCFLACDNLADGEVQGVSMPTGDSCASRAMAECVADALASPRDWKTLINDLLTQINVLTACLTQIPRDDRVMRPRRHLHFLDHRQLEWRQSILILLD